MEVLFLLFFDRFVVPLFSYFLPPFEYISLHFDTFLLNLLGFIWFVFFSFASVYSFHVDDFYLDYDGDSFISFSPFRIVFSFVFYLFSGAHLLLLLEAFDRIKEYFL